MDNMGDENLTKLVSISDEAEKWSHIAQFAAQYGFTGIQVNPTYQKTLGLKLTRIPEVICQEFRLTYHLGGLYPLSTKDDEHKLQTDISDSLLIASSIGAEDVSLHPPYLSDGSPKQRKQSRKRFQNLLGAWVPRFTAHGITLSLETHVTSSVFIFTGIQDFRDFVLSIPGLSVLVDVSHNYYDGYEITELISSLRPLHHWTSLE